MSVSNDPVSKLLGAGFLQFDVQLGDIAANMAQVGSGLDQMARRMAATPGVVVLPELWATGFAYAELPELARQTPAILNELEILAAKYNVLIAGSLVESSQDSFSRYYNTLFFVTSAGVVGRYRKHQLFAPMGEPAFFTAGGLAEPVETQWGLVAALVCYDLRFPELARYQVGQGAELLVIVAQWPMVRREHWQTLVRARAIENQVFVIAANRCGIDCDRQQTQYAGHSMIVSPDGSVLVEAGTGAAAEWLTIDRGLVAETRGRFDTATPVIRIAPS